MDAILTVLRLSLLFTQTTERISPKNTQTIFAPLQTVRIPSGSVTLSRMGIKVARGKTLQSSASELRPFRFLCSIIIISSLSSQIALQPTRAPRETPECHRAETETVEMWFPTQRTKTHAGSRIPDTRCSNRDIESKPVYWQPRYRQ